MTARTKTRFVVRRGRIGVGGEDKSVEARERENRRGGGAKTDRVPVPVLEYVEHSHYAEGRRLHGITYPDDVLHSQI